MKIYFVHMQKQYKKNYYATAHNYFAGNQLFILSFRFHGDDFERKIKEKILDNRVI